MAVPEVIPILYVPDHHTGTIGHWERGQFFGSVIAAFREGYTRTDDWPAHKRWYASGVLVRDRTVTNSGS